MSCLFHVPRCRCPVLDLPASRSIKQNKPPFFIKLPVSGILLKQHKWALTSAWGEQVHGLVHAGDKSRKRLDWKVPQQSQFRTEEHHTPAQCHVPDTGTRTRTTQPPSKCNVWSLILQMSKVGQREGQRVAHLCTAYEQRAGILTQEVRPESRLHPPRWTATPPGCPWRHLAVASGAFWCGAGGSTRAAWEAVSAHYRRWVCRGRTPL